MKGKAPITGIERFYKFADRSLLSYGILTVGSCALGLVNLMGLSDDRFTDSDYDVDIALAALEYYGYQDSVVHKEGSVSSGGSHREPFFILPGSSILFGCGPLDTHAIFHEVHLESDPELVHEAKVCFSNEVTRVIVDGEIIGP